MFPSCTYVYNFVLLKCLNKDFIIIINMLTKMLRKYMKTNAPRTHDYNYCGHKNLSTYLL